MSTSTPTRLPRRLTAAERVQRNQAIAEHLNGATWQQIAEHWGISDRQARRCAKEHAATAAGLPETLGRAGPAPEVDVGRVLAPAMQAHELALRRGLAVLIAPEGDNAAVGGMRGVAAVTASLVETLRALGMIGDPGLERFAADVNTFVGAVLAVAERHGVPPDALAEEVDRVSLAHRGARARRR